MYNPSHNHYQLHSITSLTFHVKLSRCAGYAPAYPVPFELWTEQISISSLPKIRVAQRNGQWYSIDSHRLFVLKVLGVQSAEFTEISWMEEFDSKLRFVIGCISPRLAWLVS